MTLSSLARSALHSAGPLHRLLSRYRGTRIHSASAINRKTLRLGTYYGGWTVVPDLLNADSVVYGVGVGTDISFDLGLIDRFGCAVHAFDPTPVCGDWIAAQALPERFHFHAIGLGAQDAEVAFHRPSVDGHVSFSLAGGPERPADDVVLCPVRRVSSLMDQLGHDHIDLLKMDIEGFEYQVIDDVVASNVRPSQWLIEFHHTMYNHTASETHKAVKTVIDAGYTLFDVSDVGHEYSFVRTALN